MNVLGVDEKGPPSILYSILKPGTAIIDGRANEDAHVLAGAVITGAAGKITTLTILLIAHDPAPVAPAGVAPHAMVRTYWACIV